MSNDAQQNGDVHVEQLQGELRDIKRLLYGDPATGKGGLAHNVLNMGETLYGTDRNPGGLVVQMESQKKFMWLMGGIVTATQFGLQILFHFWKP